MKPANVLFRSTDNGERAVLSDLGLGKSLDEVSRITMPGGTPSYVAPEQAMGERLDQRADQYSLGAVAYAALTGRSPHQAAPYVRRSAEKPRRFFGRKEWGRQQADAVPTGTADTCRGAAGLP